MLVFNLKLKPQVDQYKQDKELLNLNQFVAYHQKSSLFTNGLFIPTQQQTQRKEYWRRNDSLPDQPTT